MEHGTVATILGTAAGVAIVKVLEWHKSRKDRRKMDDAYKTTPPTSLPAGHQDRGWPPRSSSSGKVNVDIVEMKLVLARLERQQEHSLRQQDRMIDLMSKQQAELVPALYVMRDLCKKLVDKLDRPVDRRTL